jgi:hypothetical protein
LALALVALLPACSDNNSNPPTTPSSPTPAPEPTPEPTVATVTVTVNPVYVPAVPSGNPSLPWEISWQTTVRETAGISATVTTIDVTLVDSLITYKDADLAAASTTGSTNLPSKGTLTFNQSIVYNLADGGRLAVVSVVVWLRDSKGNLVSQVAQLRII